MAEPQTRVAAKCKTICPHFVVPDVVASAEHYRDSWGSRRGYWLDPPVFAIVVRDEVEIQFGNLIAEPFPRQTWCVANPAGTPTFGWTISMPCTPSCAGARRENSRGSCDARVQMLWTVGRR